MGNIEVEELGDAFDQYYDKRMGIKTLSDDDKKEIINKKQETRNRLLGELYDSLYEEEKYFISLFVDLILFKGDEIKTNKVNTEIEERNNCSIEIIRSDLIKTALLNTLIEPKYFYHKKKIINMFRPYELIEYIDYFDQNAYRDDINKVDEEAIIDDIQDSNQDHCIIQSLGDIRKTLGLGKNGFRKHIKRHIQYIIPYFKKYPSMFAYAFGREKILSKKNLHKIMKIYFAENYQYIKENDIIDQRF